MAFATRLILAVVVLAVGGCADDDAASALLTGRRLVPLFTDDFARASLGSAWDAQGGDWSIAQGAAHSTRARNRNLVLRQVALPADAVIELTAWSESDAVDVKFNAWGDGKIHEHGDGYAFILGGWHNRISVIARTHEHDPQRSENRDRRWAPDRRYKLRVVKVGGQIEWWVDRELFLKRTDPRPLEPTQGYKFFSLGNWESRAFYDDVKIFRVD